MHEAFSDTVVARARACLGTPFRWQGRVPGIGLDCIGLILFALDDPCLTALDRPDYDLTTPPEPLLAALETGVMRPVQRAMAGDVALISVRAQARHLGIHTAGGLVHADMSLRRVVEHRIDAGWQARILRSYRCINET